ncbi:MAG: hypothetical protein IPM71_13685 [Bacteroidota bacterium]|nr:MAG: hypothetical protein IPM71_13685 [Bacteroidota bacterium]
MKKILKFLFYFVLFVLLVMLVSPVLFKGKIIKVAHEQINANINAKGSFSDIKLSFFKQFPYLSASIQDLCVVGIEPFEGDTLIYIESFDVAVHVISAIKMENIEVKKIAINQPFVQALVLENGQANWDIAKETTEEPEVIDTSATEFNAKISLKSFQINHARIIYNDHEAKMMASLEDFNFNLKGDFSQQFSTLLIQSKTKKLCFVMDGIRYLRDVALNIDMNVDANLTENIYVLQQNSFALNDFVLTLDGRVEMPDSSDMLLDMTYATSNTDFKTLLSLVPAIYMRDYAELQTSGKLALNGSISGPLGEEVTPDVKGKLTVQNAMFRYPDLPKAADNIHIDVDYFYDGRQMDNTTVDVNRFHIEFGGNPIDMTLNLRTPISDPFINARMIAKLDLESFSDLIPLEDTELKGKVDIDLDMMGNLSLLEQEKYEDFKAQGKVLINDFKYNSSDLPKAFGIATANLEFSPQFMALNSFNATMGKSDFALQGKVSNYLPYVLNDGIISGNLSLQSNTLDLNELMGTETTEESAELEDTAAMEVFEVPTNINFTFASVINKVYYDKLEIDQLIGSIYIRDGKVVMEKLQMNTLGGSLLLSGEYSTQDIANPLFDFKFQAKQIDIPKTFAAFDFIGVIAPIASKATGNISVDMEMSSFLDKTMNPVMNSIVASGNLGSNKIGIKSSNAFNAIGKQLNSDAFNNMELTDLLFDFEIRAGKLFVNPFETKLGKSKLIIAGEQGIDKTINYGISMAIPRSLLGTSNAAVSNLAADKGIDLATSEEVNLVARLTGDMAKPNVKIDMKEMLGGTKEALKAAATKELDTKKDEAKAQAKAEADKIMKQAETQAATIRSEAKKAADLVRAESNANADKLVKQATNPIAKKAAEASATKIKSEGEKKAQQIESEADTKAQKVLDEAQAKADQLLK